MQALVLPLLVARRLVACSRGWSGGIQIQETRVSVRGGVLMRGAMAQEVSVLGCPLDALFHRRHGS